MAIDSAVYDELKAKLADSKVKIKVKVGDQEEEKSLLDYVMYVDEGVDKVKAANKDLTGQRDVWESERKEYKKNLAEMQDLKSKLETQLQDKEGATKKKSQETEELQRMINAQNDKIEQLTKIHEENQKKIVEAESRAKAANKTASEEGLRKDLLQELAEFKIVGAQADVAVTAILAKGYAKVNENSDGLYERSVCTVKEGKQLKASIKEMCKWFAEQNTFLVAASGKAGTGMQHQSTSASHGAGGNPNYFGMISQRK